MTYTFDDPKAKTTRETQVTINISGAHVIDEEKEAVGMLARN
jgi:hypothetical protein